MSIPKHSLSAGAVVLNNEGEILLIKGPRRGWEFPGGVISKSRDVREFSMHSLKRLYKRFNI
ncbi:NUDIX domain-containing protein [Virgibacillus sp. JSM 102003]|uniref:NUDIX domain-containing protein n=1 Tax=Virgibacillus sp. JSM 102003 TaxID=1562108 RepID=UPI0035C26E26